MKSEDISSNLTYHELHYAVKKDIKLLENLIKKSKEQVGELLNVQNCSGNTVLHIAAEHNSNSIQLLIEVFKEELEKLIYVKNNYGNTALHCAARHSQDSLKLLIDAFEEKVLYIENNYGNTALHWAARYNPDSLQFFIEKFGEKVAEMQNIDGESVFHLAAENPASLALLIKRFGKKAIEVKNSNGNTAAHLAACLNPVSLKLLIDTFGKEVIKVVNNDESTALYWATKYTPESLRLLIEAFEERLFEIKDNDLNTVLHWAAEYNVNSFKLLIEKFGRKVFEIVNKYNQTALQFAIQYKPDSLKLLIDVFGEEILQLQDTLDNTILHYAAHHNFDSLKLLIDTFGERLLAVKNIYGSTVLHTAAQVRPDSLKFLVAAFPEEVERLLDEKNKFGVTVIHLANARDLSHLIDIDLLEATIDRLKEGMLQITDNNGNTLLHFTAGDHTGLLKLLTDIYQNDDQDIHNNIALSLNYKGLLQLLMERSRDKLLNVKNVEGNLVLYLPAKHNKCLMELLVDKFHHKVLDVEDNEGNTVLHWAIKHNSGSLKLLIDKLPEKIENLINVSDQYGNTLLHLAARYNLDSLEILLDRFQEKAKDSLKPQFMEHKTLLHYAAQHNIYSLQLLTDRFQDQVRESLVIGNEYCQTLLYWAVEHNQYSLQFLIDIFPDEVKYLLRMENEFHETVLGWAVQYNTNSLTLFMNRFSEVIQDSLLLSNNCNCSALLHRAAQHNRYSLEILINSFVNEHIRNDLLNTKDFKGNTLIHLAAKYNVESLIFLINEFPGQVMKMLEVKNNIGETALRFAACNTTSIKLINNFLGVEIYGAERGISIPGIPGALSYYYQDQVSLLLKLRLEDAKPGILKSIDVLDENYVLIDGNEDDLSAKLSSFILNSEKNTILMPLNISGNHLVGIAAEKYNGKVILHYMDSELNSPPASLFMKIGAMLESYGYSMEFRIAKVDEQNYSNCGPEVIENLTAFASGKTRTSQEKAIPKHSTLFEKYLLKNSNDNNNTHESIIKSTPVISESATILGNTLFYEISRVSGITKSIELKIANTYILLDDKTEAQLIYYYNTGELLNYARIMLEGSSVEIQERYKFFITSEKLEVSMPDIFITDGKLQAQILYYLQTGEAFSSARSALESGAVRVTSLSSTTSEEEVENIVPLRSLARIKNEDSYSDSGENLDFSEDLFTNESTGGLLKNWLNILINLSPTTLLESL